MKLSIFAASAILAMCATSAHAETSATAAAESEVLVTQISDDGTVAKVREADGSVTTLTAEQTKELVAALSESQDIAQEGGHLIAAPDIASDQCSNNSCIEQAWWGGWHSHHGGWGWHHHMWHHDHYRHFGGWHWHHWHRWHHHGW